MAEEKYLHSEQHYIDRYDLWTIEKCRDLVKTFQDLYQRCLADEAMKDESQEEIYRSVNVMLNRQLFIVLATEYQKKAETIQKWMYEDGIKQEKYSNTLPPTGVRCIKCGAAMHSTFRTLHTYKDDTERVLFFFDCASCTKRRALWDNGEEWEGAKPRLCSKCDQEVESTHTKKGQVITWTMHCSSCGYTETEVDDLAKGTAEYEQKQQQEKALLEKYRAEYCLSDEKGKEYVENLEAMLVSSEVYEEELEKYDSLAYRQSSELKRLNIVELEKYLNDFLTKEHYIRLFLDKPEIRQYVIVPFSIQDAESSRTENTSVYQLQKLLKDSLDKTNWRLMSDGLSYRLGYISGRLKGYEREEDLMELYDKKEPKKKVSKVDPEMKRRYSGHNLVQYAKMAGRMQGVENIRKRRLEKEPNGFFLEAHEGPLTCGICRQVVPGNKIWWTLDGLSCADCRRNIEEKVIPPLSWEKKDNIWMQKWDIERDYDLHSATVRKLERQGIIKGRQLKTPEGRVYYTVYLVEDNSEFLQKYPKKERK